MKPEYFIFGYTYGFPLYNKVPVGKTKFSNNLPCIVKPNPDTDVYHVSANISPIFVF